MTYCVYYTILYILYYTTYCVYYTILYMLYDLLYKWQALNNKI